MTGTIFVFVCGTANAAEHIYVLRGEHCPPKTKPISAAQVLKSRAQDCKLVDPSVRLRISPGSEFTVSAETCEDQADQIRILGAIMCSLSDPSPPRLSMSTEEADHSSLQADHHSTSEKEKSVVIYGRSGPVTVTKGTVFQIFIKYIFFPFFIFFYFFAMYNLVRAVKQTGGGKSRMIRIFLGLSASAILFGLQFYNVVIL